MINEFKTGYRLLSLAVKGNLPLDIFLTEAESIPSFSTFLLITQWLILFGLCLRTWIYRDYYTLSHNSQQRILLFIALSLYCILLIVVSIIHLRISRLSTNPIVLWGRAIIITLLFSIVYYTTGKEESDLFLLYLIPLLNVIEYINFRLFICFSIFVILCFGTVILMLAPLSPRTAAELVLNVFMMRGMLVIFIGIVGLFFSRTLTIQKRAFLSMLTTMGNGVSLIDTNMRLLYFNKFEQELNPDAKKGDI